MLQYIQVKLPVDSAIPRLDFRETCDPRQLQLYATTAASSSPSESFSPKEDDLLITNISAGSEAPWGLDLEKG